MIFAIELKKCVAGISILGIVIDKIRHKKKLCPTILFEINKGLKIGFYCIILLFSLAVCLRMESDGEFPLDIKEIA